MPTTEAHLNTETTLTYNDLNYCINVIQRGATSEREGAMSPLFILKNEKSALVLGKKYPGCVHL